MLIVGLQVRRPFMHANSMLEFCTEYTTKEPHIQTTPTHQVPLVKRLYWFILYVSVFTLIQSRNLLSKNINLLHFIKCPSIKCVQWPGCNEQAMLYTIYNSHNNSFVHTSCHMQIIYVPTSFTSGSEFIYFGSHLVVLISFLVTWVRNKTSLPLIWIIQLHL